MSKNLCSQCSVDASDAIHRNFTHHFLLDQNGIIHFGQQIFDLELFVIDDVKTCIRCAKSTFWITLPNGIKGQATEYWEN